MPDGKPQPKFAMACPPVGPGGPNNDIRRFLRHVSQSAEVATASTWRQIVTFRAFLIAVGFLDNLCMLSYVLCNTKVPAWV